MRDTGILGKILYLFNKQKCPTPPKMMMQGDMIGIKEMRK